MICTPCTNGQHCGPPGCASAHCPCQHWPRTSLAAGLPAPPAFPVSVDPGRPARESEGRTANSDQGVAGVLKDVPVPALLSEWMRAVRAGQEGKAHMIHGVLADRLGRLA